MTFKKAVKLPLGSSDSTTGWSCLHLRRRLSDKILFLSWPEGKVRKPPIHKQLLSLCRSLSMSTMCPQLHWSLVFSLFFPSLLWHILKPTPSVPLAQTQACRTEQAGLLQQTRTLCSQSSHLSPGVNVRRHRPPPASPPRAPRRPRTQHRPAEAEPCEESAAAVVVAAARWKTRVGRKEEEEGEQTSQWHHRRHETKMTCGHQKWV